MLDRLVRFCTVTLILLVPMSTFPAWGQTASQTTTPSTTPGTTKTTPAAKPAPKPTPTIPAAKAASPTAPSAAKPVLPATRATARPLPTTSMPASQALPTRGAGGTGIVAGGKGAAIGAAVPTNANNVSAVPTVVPAVRGRPAIPTPASAAATVSTTNGRAAIPTPASSKVGSTASTSYLPSTSSSSGRSSIPTYASSSSNAAAAPAGTATPGPNGSLGTFTYGEGMLTVYGCTRQGSQVLCDADFNNQNQRVTQVNTAWWRDVYLVDQYGDRHQRASAYFVNGAGEPREMLDIPYGQSARYIMVFNDFNPNVGSVGFHSVYGNIDIENMSLDGSGGTVAGGDQQAQAAAQGNSAVGNSVNGATDSLKANGKQRASDARDKAVNKANDSMQKLMDRIPH